VHLNIYPEGEGTLRWISYLVQMACFVENENLE